MCYVIVTSRSLLWLLLSLLALLIMLSAFMSASWLIGPSEPGRRDVSSEGIYTRCKVMSIEKQLHCGPFAMDGLATSGEVFPGAWKATMFFLALGLSIMTVTVFCGIVGCCFQSVFKKSIFTISGAAQAIAGIAYIMGGMLYPIAWGEPRVVRVCKMGSAAFYPNQCSLGWGLYAAVAGTALTFLCACLSVTAERATSSDKVQDKIHEGRTLICLA